jgi:hypothetical protein
MLNKLTNLITGLGPLSWGIVAVISFGAVVAGLYINSVFQERKQLLADKAVLEANNAELKADLASAKRSLADNFAALQDVEARKESSKLAKIESEMKLEKLNNDNQEVCSWGSTNVPDDVWSWVCEETILPRAAAPDTANGLPYVNP